MQFYPFTQQQQQQQHGVYEMSITFCSQCIDSLFVAVAADAAVNNVAQSRRESIREINMCPCIHHHHQRLCVCAPLFFSSSFDNDIDQFRDCRLFGFILSSAHRRMVSLLYCDCQQQLTAEKKERI